MKYRLAVAAVIFAGAGVAAGADAPAQADRSPGSGYRVVGRFEVGGEGGWDFLAVDEKRHHLLVTRGDAVQVVDMADGRLIATLTGLHGSHGVAVAGDQAFISNGRSNSVTVVDLDTLKTTGSIDVAGIGPDAILYDSQAGTVYTMNHNSGNISVIRAGGSKPGATIPAADGLEVAVLDGKGRLFVNAEDAGQIIMVDTATGKRMAQWKLGSCEGPTGLAIDTAHDRLFTVCANNRMMVVDATSGRLVAELPIGARPDGAAFDPALGNAYSSNGEGSLTVVHEDDAEHFHVVENLPTQAGARTIALDPATHRLYLPAASYGPVPAATADAPKPRAPMIPGSFRILVVEPPGAN